MTTQEKIKILESVDWESMVYFKTGLCFAISELIRNKVPTPVGINQIVDYIDLFTRENAIQISSCTIPLDTWSYWFPLDRQGYRERKQFVDWMINEYKKQIP